MKTNPEVLNKWRTAHHRALETLRSPDCQLSGIQIWRKLCQLESVAHACATARCNGERIQCTFPLLPSGRGMPQEFDFARDENAWDRVVSSARDCVRNIFGRIPEGFTVNGDCRGYALKLDPEETTIPEGMDTDWGRNGILAAQIKS